MKLIFKRNTGQGLYKSYVGLPRINLQLFANDEKTEKPTPKRRRDARKKGQVFQSREITNAVMLISLFSGLKVFGGNIYYEVSNFARRILTEYPKIEGLYTVKSLSMLFFEAVGVLLKASAPLFAIAVVTGLVSGFAQVGFLFTTETLGFKFSRINPASGIKRLFSLRALTELLKSLIKISIIGYVAYSYLRSEEENIINTINTDVMSSAMYIGATSINMAVRICIALLILGALDYLYQWWEYEKSLRMTKQEIKEEYKMTEGNPQIKSKIRQKQRQISMRRMLQDVPKADVIITNPTHLAVAIKYDAEVSDAPVVLAKGQDYMALRIKEKAREHDVQIVENKPLARALYESVEIGEAIPPQLYQAVAEVLAFVYSLKQPKVKT